MQITFTCNLTTKLPAAARDARRVLQHEGREVREGEDGGGGVAPATLQEPWLFFPGITTTGRVGRVIFQATNKLLNNLFVQQFVNKQIVCSTIFARNC